ncbi:MAG: SHOCT domain-containing protein [Moraxellaceae bacterium]|nr:SHOCT domain-containing protein [Moraxellaceae bacterium]
MNYFKKAVLASTIVAVSGCASIVSKSQYPVTISSTPSGATVVIKNKSGAEIHKAQTPTTITLNASSGFFSAAQYSMEFQKDGYQNSTATTQAGIDGWYIANILFGGLLGLLIIDPATGAMWKLDESVTSSLAANSPPTAAQVPVMLNDPASGQMAAPDAPAIAEQLKLLKNLRDEGALTADEYETKRKAVIEKL